MIFCSLCSQNGRRDRHRDSAELYIEKRNTWILLNSDFLQTKRREYWDLLKCITQYALNNWIRIEEFHLFKTRGLWRKVVLIDLIVVLCLNDNFYTRHCVVEFLFNFFLSCLVWFYNLILVSEKYSSIYLRIYDILIIYKYTYPFFSNHLK